MEVTQKPQWLWKWLWTSLQKAQKAACSDTSNLNYVLPSIHHLGLVDLKDFMGIPDVRSFKQVILPILLPCFILTWTRTWSFHTIPLNS